MSFALLFIKTVTTKRRLIMKKNRNGFTLIELMICISIVGILCAIIIPQFLMSKNNALTHEELYRVPTSIITAFVFDDERQIYTVRVTAMETGKQYRYRLNRDSVLFFLTNEIDRLPLKKNY
jgi:prepilin-type N-terminal cleavage/methylation domain-containing protein